MSQIKIIILFFFLISSGYGLELSNFEYQEIKKISKQIMEDCPPKSCVVIGVGRSPSPILAFLEQYEEGYAHPLPLSNFRHNPHEDVYKSMKKNSPSRQQWKINFLLISKNNYH